MSARVRIAVSMTCLLSAVRPCGAQVLDLVGEPRGVSVAVSTQVEQSSRGAAVLGMLTLNVPLDRFSARYAKSPAHPEVAEPQQAGGEGGAAPSSSETASAEAAPESVEVPAFVLTEELAHATLTRALLVAGHRSARHRLDGIASRARASAGLPELRLRAARVTDESLRLSPTLDDPSRYTHVGGTNLLFEARATWQLDRLLFANEELAVERLRGEQARARAALAERVLKALFAWQRGELKARAPGADAVQRAEFLLAALEAELILNVLTGGWFSEAVRTLAAPAAETAAFEARSPDRRGPGQGAGQDRQQAVDNARHACRDTHYAPGPQAARRCAKGVSLTSRHSDAK
jgi:hypothetical protein